jgi:RHS repeat-associated protein
VTTTSGTPQHTTISGSRGNTTTVQYLTSGSTYLTQTYSYYDTGNVNVFTDVNSGQTTYAYGSSTSCGNSFATGVTEAVTTLSQSYAWNCTGGVRTSTTDENSQVWSAAFADPNYWRPTSTTDPASATTSLCYWPDGPSGCTSHSGLFASESRLNFNGSTSTADTLTAVDGLGRTHVTQQLQTQAGSNYDSVETDYNAEGLPYQVTVPYTGTAGQTNSSATRTVTTYDTLGRPRTVTDGGGGTTTYTYLQTPGSSPVGFDVLVTVSGGQSFTRQYEYDGLGRLTSVCEVTSASGSASCGQSVAAIGYLTKYTYDVLNDLLTVKQNAQSSTYQTRTYTYDALGRMTSEQNPETNQVAYTYTFDTDTTCGTHHGDLVKRTDALNPATVTCYAYDLLHRLTSVTYPSGGYASVTPAKTYVYDAATVGSTPMSYAKSRLAEAYTGTSTSKTTDLDFSYTTRGEVAGVYQSSPHSSGYYNIGATYWAPQGLLDVLTPNMGSSIPIWTYAPDGEGRVNTVSANSGTNPVTATSYNGFSEPLGITLGSGDSDAFQYDPNTGRMTQYQATIDGSSAYGTLTWNANWTLQSLSTFDPFNSGISAAPVAGSNAVLYQDPGASWQLVGAGDFDGNGTPDLVYWDPNNGDVVVDYYSGATLTSYAYLHAQPSPWKVVAVADVNGDGVPDLIWQNTSTNQVTVNYYGGTGGATYEGWNWMNSAGEPSGWNVVGAADFDGNGTPDLVWQYAPTTDVTVNYYSYSQANGPTYTGWAWLNSSGEPGWAVVGAADMNQDGVPDLIWINNSDSQYATGAVTVNYYGGPGGATYEGWAWLNQAGISGWSVGAVADMNGGGEPDLIWQDASSPYTVTVYYYSLEGTCNYTYDNLARLSSVNCGSVWAQTFGYDAFGNISKSGSQSFGPTYSATTNHYTAIGPVTPTYDHNGNLTSDGVYNYTWDGEGNLATLNSNAETYDALDRRVEQYNGSAYTEIVYGPAGNKFALMSGQTVTKVFTPLSAGATAVYNSSGLSYYRHPDWLGSSRIASTPSRTLYYDGAYAPFGENYAETGTTDRNFTGQNQDLASGSTGLLYDFPYRELHSTQGRWVSPDPAGVSAVDPTNPQSLNRYAYVLGNPLGSVDPLGFGSGCPPDDPCPPPPQPPNPAFGSGCVQWFMSVFNLTNGPATQYCAGLQGPPSAANYFASQATPGGGNPGPNYCAYQGSALTPQQYAAKGQEFGAGIVAMGQSYGPDVAFSFALGSLAGQFSKGGSLDAQPGATGTNRQKASYGNYTFGAFFAGAGVPLADALTAANAYGLKQQMLGRAYLDRIMDPNYSHLPAANVQAITNGYNDASRGTLCHH